MTVFQKRRRSFWTRLVWVPVVDKVRPPKKGQQTKTTKTGWWQLKYFLFSPQKLGKMNPFWRAYFSNGLVQPPTRRGKAQKTIFANLSFLSFNSSSHSLPFKGHWLTINDPMVLNCKKPLFKWRIHFINNTRGLFFFWNGRLDLRTRELKSWGI